jgi:hypothetical protein
MVQIPDLDPITKMIILDADLRDGKFDNQLTRANLTAAINDADRADGTKSNGKGDAIITAEGMDKSLYKKSWSAYYNWSAENTKRSKLEPATRDVSNRYTLAANEFAENYADTNISVSEKSVRDQVKALIAQGNLTIK